MLIAQLRINWALEKIKRSLGRKGVCVPHLRKVETEKHFILECETFKDSKDNYINILTGSSWNDLFSKG
jgi:hypothetical protein